MPTKREREYYSAGFQDGVKLTQNVMQQGTQGISPFMARELAFESAKGTRGLTPSRIERGFEEGFYPKKKRKLSAWNKFVKANSRKKEFRYRDGKLNLKKMGVAFRRKKRR